MGMRQLQEMDLQSVLQLQPAIDAGIWMKMHQAGPKGEDLYLYRSEHRYVVSSPGATIVKVFESLPDAWSYFTGRTVTCPICNGDGTVPGPAVGVVCSVCRQFGAISDYKYQNYMLNLRMGRI